MVVTGDSASNAARLAQQPAADPTFSTVTAGQEQIWLSQQLAPAAAIHHLPLTVRITGPLDLEALRRSLDAVVTRQDSLRTVFRLQDGALTQQVLADVPQLAIYDLESMPPQTRGPRLDAIRAEQTAQPFDLEKGPAIRFVVVITDFDEYELVVVVHRIVADEASLEIFAAELLDCYAAFTQHRRPALDPAPFRFADHASEQVRREPAAADLDYWREQLSELGDPLDLPFAQPRPDAPGWDATVAGFELAQPVADQLRTLAEQERTTTQTAMLAGFVVLLHRYTRSSDIVLATTAAGRERPAADQVIGCFAGPAVLRIRLPYDPTWRQVLGLVRDVCAGAAEHQDVSFAEVIRAVRPARHPGLHPVFQILVAPPGVQSVRTVGGVSFSVAGGDSGQARYDVELRAGAGGGFLKLARDLFGAERAPVVLGHYLALLERMAAEPDGHLSGHSLLAESQQRTILRDWNDTGTDYPRERTIPGLFASWAQHAPGAPALRWEDFSLTYRELEARSNQLAHHLRRRGVGVETGVGLYFGYTADWVISALATLKAGGYYVPLDPAYPEDRLAAMCQDADVRVLLMHASAASRLETVQAERVFMDADADAGAVRAEPASRPGVDLGPDHLAYIMFTSGSTGRPKAIGVTHRNVIRTVCSTPYVDFGTTDRVGQASNISFDAATFELWGALLNGSQLIGLRKEDVLDPDRLKAQLHANAITIFFQPAALMKQIIAEKPDTFDSLTYFFSGGEQADLHAVRRLLKYGPPAHLVNPYGPTETTVFAIVYRCNDLPDDATYVPIGRPIGNTTAYVLDGYLQPVPIGVVGELFIGGDGVARGYIGQSDLTAEKFVPDPFGGEPGARLYRTGDLARYRPDGLLDFLGRIDRQVKIRGFRVEPAEIETCLLGSGLVREVSVQVGRDRSGDQVLTAYLTPAEGGTDSVPSVDPEQLRAYARAQLPGYMVPTNYVTLEVFPINVNGKLDVPTLTRSGSVDVSCVPPEETPTESLLLGLWREALGDDELTVAADVFSAGADSLIAARVLRAAGRAIGADLPFGLLFEHPNVMAMAPIVDRLRPAAAPAQSMEPAAGTADADALSRDRVERLLDIWRDVLESPALGPDDDFFLSGGHSLKVVRVRSRVKLSLGVDVPVTLLFENPTVRTFAAAIENMKAVAAPTVEAAGLSRAQDDGDINDLLREIERLTESDANGPLGSGS